MPTWTDKTGKVWELPDMTDSHLLNTYRFLGRQKQKAQAAVSVLSMFVGGDGDGAYYAEQDFDYACDAEFAYEAKQQELLAEIKKRGLEGCL